MREYRAKAIINAAASDVFKVLTDANAYPQFDPNCVLVDGHFAQGKRIALIDKLASARTRVRITLLSPNDVMIWELGLPFHLLKRVRTFKVIAKDEQTTEFQLSEVQSGYLLELLTSRLPDQNQAFQEFAKGLKKYIESRP